VEAPVERPGLSRFCGRRADGERRKRAGSVVFLYNRGSSLGAAAMRVNDTESWHEAFLSKVGIYVLVPMRVQAGCQGVRGKEVTERNSTIERVRKHRAALRAAGLRPVQIWVPDTRLRGFAAECRRQSLSLRDDPLEREALEWLDKVADRDDWK